MIARFVHWYRVKRMAAHARRMWAAETPKKVCAHCQQLEAQNALLLSRNDALQNQNNELMQSPAFGNFSAALKDLQLEVTRLSSELRISNLQLAEAKANLRIVTMTSTPAVQR